MCCAVFVSVFSTSIFALASGPSSNRILNYQIRLTSSTGVPVADGSLNLKLTFYDSSTDGTQLYTACSSDGSPTGTPAAVSATFSNGSSSVLIGDTAVTCATGTAVAMPGTIFNNAAIYLGVTASTDAEMTPRKRIVAAGYALNADRLDDLETSSSGGANAFVPVTDASGNFTLTKNVTFGTGSGFSYQASTDRVGVGFSNPTYRLSVAGDGYFGYSGNTFVRVDRAATADYAQFVVMNGGSTRWGMGLASNASDDLVFSTDGTAAGSRLNIQRLTGNVGIGIASPSATLDVAGSVRLGLASTDAVTVRGMLALSGFADSELGGTNGQTYYNSTLNKFRCYQNSAWTDCIAAGSVTGSGAQYQIAFWSSASGLVGSGPGTSGQLLISQGAGAYPSLNAMSGDATISNTGALTLATVNPNVGAYGAAGQATVVTVNGKGLVTAVSTTDIAIAAGQVTSGTLAVARGGTGTSTAFTAGSVVFAGASGTYGQDNANFFWDASNSRLGIGTATPVSKLDVENGSVLFAGTTGSTPVSGAGTRLMWVPAKYAFRAGKVTVGSWDDANVGTASVAMGQDTVASGNGSTAFGIQSTASGLMSFAAGGSTGSGDFSVAMGTGATASSQAGIALGDSVTASGISGVALGRQATASGTGAFAAGEYVTAGTGTHAMTIGAGVDGTNKLVNTTANSLAVGFNSTIPTLYVGPSTGVGTIGAVGIGDVSPASLLTVGNGDLFQVNATGDVFGVMTTLDGSTTASGSGTLSPTLVLTSATNFNVGNYVKVASATCAANPCYAKITNIATNDLTITPALSWSTSDVVTEVHVPEIGGTDTAQPLANRYGRGYFIDGIAAGNGSTYFSDNRIESGNTLKINTVGNQPLNFGTGTITLPQSTTLNFSSGTGAGNISHNGTSFSFGSRATTAEYWQSSSAGAGVYLSNATGYVESAGPSKLSSDVADGATAVGAILTTSTTLANASAKLLSIRNNNVEKAYVDTAGSWVSLVPSGSDAFKMLSGARLNFSTVDTSSYIYRSATDTIRTPGSLIVDGNTTLGDATTDLLTVSGAMSIGTNTYGAQLQVNPTTIGTIGLIDRAANGQTADLQQWQQWNGNVYAGVDAVGRLYINNPGTGGQPLAAIGSGATAIGNTQIGVIPGHVAWAAIIARGLASQSGELQRWEDSSGTMLAAVAADGSFTTKGTTTLGDASVDLITMAGMAQLTGFANSEAGGTNGQIYYNSTSNKFRCRQNSAWTDCITAAGGTMSSFTLAGSSGSNQTITDGNTLTIAQGSGIATVGGATDTVTVSLGNLTGAWTQTGVFAITHAGNLTVNGTTTLGDATGDTVTVTGYLGSSLIPNSSLTYDLGSTTDRWRDLFVGPASLHIGIAGNESRIGFATGTGRLEFDANGNGTAEVYIDGSGNLVATGTITSQSSGTTAIAGALTVAGNTTLGDASIDTITFNANSLSIPNDLNFDANTLFVDAANNRIGIGTTTPSSLLTVREPVSFDKVFYYNGSTYTDYTTAAKTSNDYPAHTLLAATVDYFYVGGLTQFTAVYVDMSAAGVGITLGAEYWNGSSWATLSVTDGTTNLTKDGAITFTAPGSWATTSVNGSTDYWVRLKTTSGPSTTPIAFTTTPTSADKFSVFAAAGDATPSLAVGASGSVSIGPVTVGAGSPSPAKRLTVFGRVNEDGIGTGPIALIGGDNNSAILRALTLGNYNTGFQSVELGFQTMNIAQTVFDLAVIKASEITRTAGLEDGDLVFSTMGSGTLAERMRIKSTGNVGIGTTTVGSLLTVGTTGGLTVNTSGAITAATGITSSGTITFSGFTSNGGALYTNGSGVVAQATAGTAVQILHGGTTPTFSTINASTDITTGVLPVANGGTAFSSYATGDLLVGGASAGLTKLADVATGNALISGGVGVAPSWGKIVLGTHTTGTYDTTADTIADDGTITLTSEVAGVLPVANGGTGTGTAFSSGSVVFAGASGTYSQSNSTFFWDATNSRLGLGTTTPGDALDVNGAMRASSGYKIGALSVLFQSGSDILVNNSASQKIRLTQAGSDRLMVDTTGYVGIGSSTPSSLLDVAGTVKLGAASTDLVSLIGMTQHTGFANSEAGGTNGQIYYNSTLNKFRCYENSAWKDCISSASGMTSFTLAGSSGSNQTITDGNTLTIAQGSGIATVGGATDTVTVSLGNLTGAWNQTGVFAITHAGSLTVNGTTTLGDATADAISFNGYVATSIIPTTDNAGDLGSTTNRWKTLHVGPGSVVVHNDATDTAKATLGFSGATAQLVTDASTRLRLTTGSNVGLNLTTTGNLGLGTTDSLARLTVLGANTTGGLGADMVTNGDFYGGYTGWTWGTNWFPDTYTYCYLDFVCAERNTAAATSDLTQSLPGIVAGTQYKISFTTNVISGSVTPMLGSVSGTPLTSLSFQTIYLTAAASGTVDLIFRANASFVGTIEYVSVQSLNLSDSVVTILNSNGTAGLELRAGGASLRNSFIGINAGITTGVVDNTAFGYAALSGNTLGQGNTAIGSEALKVNAAHYNTALGYRSLYSTVNGGYNLAAGVASMLNSTNGSYNVALGYGAMSDATADTLSNNVAIGYNAGGRMYTGSNNVAIGANAMYWNRGGVYNSAVGVSSLYSLTNGSYNSALGQGALSSLSSGSYNVAVGNDALAYATSDSYSTALGYRAGYSLTGGQYNVAIGAQALYGGFSSTNGGDNSALGYRSLYSLTLGGKNTAVGSQALYSSTNDSDNTAVGYRSGYWMQRGASYNTAVGSYSMYGNYLSNYLSSSRNSAFGYGTLYSLTTGADNTAIGYGSAGNLRTGNGNTALGSDSLKFSTTDYYNTAIGYQAGYFVAGGGGNVAIGYAAMYGNAAYTTGFSNIAVGNEALTKVVGGSYNTAIGTRALYNSTTDSENIAIGYFAGYRIVQGGTQNVSIGDYSTYGSGFNNTTGTDNAALGNGSLYSLTSGSYNTAIGRLSLNGITTGGSNAALGYQTLYGSTTGGSNTAIGYQAGYAGTALSTATSDTFIGYGAGLSGAQYSRSTAIGYNARVAADDSIVLGDPTNAALKFGIGTTSPLSILHLNKSGSGNYLRFTEGGTLRGVLGVSAGSSDLLAGDLDNDFVIRGETNVLFGIGAGEKMRLTSAGNLGIGTTTAGSLLTVGSTGQFTVDSSGNVATAGLTNTEKVNAQISQKYGDATSDNWKIASLPLSSADTFDHLIVNLVGGGWLAGNQHEIRALFANRSGFNYTWSMKGAAADACGSIRAYNNSGTTDIYVYNPSGVYCASTSVSVLLTGVQATAYATPTNTTGTPTGTLIFNSGAPTTYPPTIGESNTSGRVGIGTTSPSTKFQVNTKVADDGSISYDTDTTYLVHQTPTSTSTLNDPKSTLLIARQGTSGQAYGAAASFNLSRYENNGVNSRTRLDISLAHTSFDVMSNNIMTMYSSGQIGIGSTPGSDKVYIYDNATGTGNAALNVSRPINNNGYGIWVNNNGGSTGNSFGIYSSASHSGSANNYGVAGYASGGTNNYDLYAGSSSRIGALAIPGVATTAIPIYWSSGTGGSTGYFSYNSSSIRFKENVQDVNFDEGDFYRLRPVNFTWKSDGSADLGMIAEDTEIVAPKLVFHDASGDAAGIRYEKITIYLLDALKKLHSRTVVADQGGTIGLATPATPNVYIQGVHASTTWGYRVAALSASGKTMASLEGTVTAGAASLDGTDFNRVVWTSVPNAAGYAVYRTTAGGNPSSVGLIGTTNGAVSFDDVGLPATGSVPTEDISGALGLGASGLATSFAPSKDSYPLFFRGSAWDASADAAVDVKLSFTNAVTDKDNYRLALKNQLGAEVSYLGSNGDVALSGRLFPSDRGVMQTNKYIWYDGSAGPGGDMMRTNAAGWSTGSYDFAEMFPSKDALAPGDIVMIDVANDESVRMADGSGMTDGYLLAGIVSTRPGFLAGMNDAGSYPVAMSGRVPTKVSLENGDIRIGDPITVSSVPGVGMKANPNSYVVGIALEPYVAGNDPKTVSVFLKPGWYNGAGVSGPTTSTSTASLDVSGPVDLKGQSILNVGNISGLGDLWSIDASGKMIIREVNADIVATKSVRVRQTDSMTTLGTATIDTLGQAAVVANPAVKADSQIFITFRKNPNGSWWLDEVHDGMFIVKLSQPTAEPVVFSYWIVDVADERTPAPAVTPPSPPPSDTVSPDPASSDTVTPPPTDPPPTDTATTDPPPSDPATTDQTPVP